MNKTLLLIICDFLLLNLIHFTAWDLLDEEYSKKTPSTGGPAVSGVGMGDPSRDLEFVTLKYKNVKADRENERIRNAALDAELNANEQQSAENLAAAVKNAHAWKNVFDKSTETNKVLAAATNELSRAQVIALAERDKERTLKETITQEQIKLQTNNRDLTNKVNNLTGKIGDLNIRVTKAEGNADAERKRAEQEAAKAQAALIAKTKAEGERDKAVTIAATAKLTADNQIKTIRTFAAQQITGANTRVVNAEKEVKVAVAETQAAKVQVAETTKELTVAVAKTEELAKDVIQEKTEKQIAQKAVQELRDNIAKRIPDQPINANTMATLYFQNQLELKLQVIRGLGRKKIASPTILIEVMEEDGPYVHAITHVKDTPYQLAGNALAFRESYGVLTPQKNKPQALHHVRFLKSDPRVIIIPLGPAGSAQVKALGVKPYKLAAKPYKFPKAFIMSKTGRKYGEVEFKIDPKSRGYVKVDRIFFNFSGKFNPAKGDLVFSQTGELLGIMVNNKYCLVLKMLHQPARLCSEKMIQKELLRS